MILKNYKYNILIKYRQICLGLPKGMKNENISKNKNIRIRISGQF
jgi:hypothetical protein